MLIKYQIIKYSLIKSNKFYQRQKFRMSKIHAGITHAFQMAVRAFLAESRKIKVKSIRHIYLAKLSLRYFKVLIKALDSMVKKKPTTHLARKNFLLPKL